MTCLVAGLWKLMVNTISCLNMEEYVKLFDECMYNMHSEEADLIEQAIQEANLTIAMWEEYMWYKHEDYMLYIKANCY